MVVNQQTLNAAKTYADKALSDHVGASNPHAVAGYLRAVDLAGLPIDDFQLMYLPAGGTLPKPPPAHGVAMGPDGVFSPNETGTGWVQLGQGGIPVDQTPPTTPGALTVTDRQPTSLTVTWTASTDDASGVARYETALGAAGTFTTNGTAFTKTYTGLTAGTQYVIRVRAVDGAGNVSAEASVTVVTTNPTDTTPPGAPPNLHSTAITAAEVDLAWSAATDTGGGTIARYEVSKNSTTVYASVGASLTAQMTGLTASTTYTFRVRAVDTSGNISPVSTLTVTTNAPQTVTLSTLMGVSKNTSTEYSTWDSWRVYALTDAAPAVALGAKTVAVSDDPHVSRTGGAASATQLRNALLAFYGSAGTPTKNASIEYHYGNGNEVDAESVTGQAFADTYELMETVIADFPMASLWFDATRTHLVTGVTLTMLNSTASSGRKVYQMLDGLAGSYYPPSAFNSGNVTAQTFTAAANQPAAVIDPYMALMVQLGIKNASIWEYGMPLGWNPPLGATNAGATYKDNDIRRTYTTSFIAYWLQACVNNNITPKVATYWDVDGTPNGGDVRLVNDQTRTSPDTATIWRNAVATFNA